MKYDILALKRKMLVKYPFFGNVITNVSYCEDESIKTAETDGNTVYYNPLFLAKLEPIQQVFVLAHEVCHIAFHHVERSIGKDNDIWNIATDAVINSLLKRDGLKLTDGAIDISDAINYNAEKLYEILLKQKEHIKKEHNVHSMWIKAKDKTSRDENSSKTSQNINEQEAFRENTKEKKKNLEEFKKGLLDKAKRGTTTDSNTLKVSNIGTDKPLIDWRCILHDTTNFDVDYSYENATIEDGVVEARLEKIPIPEVEIVLDTSGSINEELLKSFLKECKNILKHSELKIGCFDTKFYGFNVVKTAQDIDNMKFVGGGGTDFNAAVSAFTRRVDNKVIFTDGEAPIPNKSCNAIWIVFGNKNINPKGGKVFYVSKDALKTKVKRLIKY